jgi:DNA primase
MAEGETASRAGSERPSELYTALIAALPLSAAHRAALKDERGFTDDTIDRCRFRSGGEHVFDLVRELQRQCGASDPELIGAGLLAPSKKTGELYANGQLAGDRVIIPYLRADGETCYFLRPHKLGFKGHGVQLYSEHTMRGWAEHDTLILTEGEFKAAAAAQLGYRALAVPGVSSFAGQHYERLEKAVRDAGAKRVVILFDRETKADPDLPGFKEDPRKRYDVEWYSWLLATRLDVLIGELPANWMRDGKIDIDGALAQGRPPAQFEKVIKGAVAPPFYLDHLSTEAGAIVGRKVRRYLKRDKPKALKVFDSRHAGCGYMWEEPVGDGSEIRLEHVSNFVLKLERIVQTDTQVERVVRVIDNLGEESAPLIVEPADMSGLRSWRQWCASKGDYDWPGKQHHLSAVWEHLHAQSDGVIIRRTVLGGEIEPGLWLFQNGIITGGRYRAPREEDGLVWVGRRGFEMAEAEGQPCIQRDDPEGARVLDDEHRDLLVLLRDNLRHPTMWLAIGWALATVFSRVLFNRFKCFPLLFHMGEASSGKTTAARWLMNGFFGIDTHGKPMMSTEKSQYRLLAKRCSLPAWFDEFREGRDMQRHVTAFCSIYNRQAYSRAVRSNDLQTDSVPVRGSLQLGGVVPPKDDQLLSRCILLNYSADERDNRDDDEGGTYAQVEAKAEKLNDFFLHALLRYDELVPDVISETLVAKSIFQKRTGNARMSLNYAMAVAAFHVVCGDLVDSRELLDFAQECMAISSERLRAEHPLGDFWEAVASMAADGYVNKDHITAHEDALYLWLPGIFQAYERNHRQRRGEVGFRVSDLQGWIARQPYWIAPANTGGRKRRTLLRRVNGRPKRVTAIRRDAAPEPLIEAWAHVEKPSPGPDTEVLF